MRWKQPSNPLNSGHSSLVTLSLTNLRGVTSESLNAAGLVTVDLATGAVTSVVQLLPPGNFDLWLVDNRSRPGHTTLAGEDFDVLMIVGTYGNALGQQSLSVPLGRAKPSPTSSPIARSWCDRAIVRCDRSC